MSSSQSTSAITSQYIDSISYANVDKSPGYAHAKFLDVDIIIDKATGWVNASQLCKKFPSRKPKSAKSSKASTTNDDAKVFFKQFKNWKRTDFAQGLMKSLNISENIPKCIKKVTDQNNPIVRGTYVHPLLIPFILAWCNYDQALNLSRVITSINGKIQLDSKEEAIAEHNGTLNKLHERLNLADQEAQQRMTTINDQYKQIQDLEQRIIDYKQEVKPVLDNEAVLPPSAPLHNIVMVVNKLFNMPENYTYISNHEFNSRILVHRIQIISKKSTLDLDRTSKCEWAQDIFTLPTTYAVPAWIIARELLKQDDMITYKKKVMMLSPGTTGRDICDRIQHVHDNRHHYNLEGTPAQIKRRIKSMSSKTKKSSVAKADDSDDDSDSDEETDDEEDFVIGDQYTSDTDEAVNGPHANDEDSDTDSDISTNSNSSQ